MDLKRTKLMRVLRAQLKAAPKQAKLLGALGLVFVIALLRMILTLGPKTTEAALTPIAAPQGTPMAARPAPSTAPPRTNPRPALPDLPAQSVRDLFVAAWWDRGATTTPEPLIEPVPDGTAPRVDIEPTDLVLELTLTGATDSGQHCAVISGKRVRVGESVRGYRVESIAPGLVVLSEPERGRIVIRMN